VKEAHCEISPKWANGAKLLIPFTEQQRDDLAAVGKELQSHHIVALRSDFPAIQAAFANCRKRPKIEGDEKFFDLTVEEAWPDTDSSLGFGQLALD